MTRIGHCPKFTKHFWSNINYFPVDYYFRPYQTPENAEIIFHKSFYAKTNAALVAVPLNNLFGCGCLAILAVIRGEVTAHGRGIDPKLRE
jgi:hypothetical protein